MNAPVPAPGRVAFFDGQNEFPMLECTTSWSSVEMYLHGAHVTQFRLKNQPNLLFMSQCSRFEPNQPIRGGIPIIFPWFGVREGMGIHGFARLKTWDLKEMAPNPDGSVSVLFRLPDCPEAGTLPPFTADYRVTASESLTLELMVTNLSKEESFTFENCLHTYFEIGDITAISVHGLQGTDYLDKVDSFTKKTERSEAIRISSEVDRVYLNTQTPVEIHDPRLGRKIIIEKTGSNSTVLWNPWIAKAQQMPDFGNEEYQKMVCVESGNVAVNQLTLSPGESSNMTVKISSVPLD